MKLMWKGLLLGCTAASLALAQNPTNARAANNLDMAYAAACQLEKRRADFNAPGISIMPTSARPSI